MRKYCPGMDICESADGPKDRNRGLHLRHLGLLRDPGLRLAASIGHRRRNRDRNIAVVFDKSVQRLATGPLRRDGNDHVEPAQCFSDPDEALQDDDQHRLGNDRRRWQCDD